MTRALRDSDRGHGHFIKTTLDKGDIIKYERHATWAFLKIDMGYEDPPIRSPMVNSTCRHYSKTVLIGCKENRRYEMGVSKNPFPQSTTLENDILDTHLVSTIFLAT